MSEEIWKPAPGWDFLEVSSFGRVRRCQKSPLSASTQVGRLLSIYYPKNPRRYPTVGFGHERRLKTVNVHPLVCGAFHGPKPSPAHQVAHKDGNRHNNRADNLRWATPQENTEDSRRLGVLMVADKHYAAKITSDHVRAIRALLAQGRGPTAIAGQFAIPRGIVEKIKRGETWRSVK